MKYGFLRTACASPDVTVADCTANVNKMIEMVRLASSKNVSILVFPELSVTGYTCGDLFLQSPLIKSATNELERLVAETANLPIIFIAGLPIACGNALYNCAAICFQGQILALVPKTFIPDYGEFYERRHFTSGDSATKAGVIRFSDKHQAVPFGTGIVICDRQNPELALATEICEDVWVPLPPSVNHALAGATIIANLSASNEIIGKAQYRKMLVSSQSAHLIAAYLYADAGTGESTTDMVFAAHNLIAENGTILAESPRYSSSLIIADIDIERLTQERRRTTTFSQNASANNTKTEYIHILTDFPHFEDGSLTCDGAGTSNCTGVSNCMLYRSIERRPFVPDVQAERNDRCHEVVAIQTAGLAKRLRHTNVKSAVVGLSGGLDSTLALLITVNAFKECSLDVKGITAVTMPCFGTTDRTYNNAVNLARYTGATLREIPISAAVRQHFSDIGHDEKNHDVTYENSQARERTQILMDIANQSGALVIGTGDLSELALGWATYNGDHMSMYGVNASIPKTLVRYIVGWFADTVTDSDNSASNVNHVADVHSQDNSKLQAVLRDILDTPVSPELLPPENGVISQKTEDLVGPYDLHDFFLYYMMRRGFSPSKILFLAEQAFSPDEFNHETILKWLKTFYRRFFSQQFKRSCLPDGAKAGTVSLSPRGDWRMPSDASAVIWLKELESIK